MKKTAIFKRTATAITAFAIVISMTACSFGKGSDSSQEVSSQDGGSVVKNENSYCPAMWVVKSENGGQLYMLGSMHALDNNDYPLPDEIMNAYEASDALAVECDIVAYQSDIVAQLATMQMLLCETGKTVTDYISIETYEGVKAILIEHDAYMEAYDSYVPAMLASALETVFIEESGLTATGIDETFLKRAKKDTKRIIEVESVSAQMALLSGFSNEIMEMQLRTYVETPMAEILEEYSTLHKAWRNGNVEALLEAEEEEIAELSAEEQAIYAEYDTAMMTDRNELMANTAIELLEGGEKVFFIVGAAHFPGDDGIIALLEGAGYAPERIVYADEFQ